ncbi:MAG: L,D-transpeptidase [Rhizobiales bacterium]|nr:L,D-transpeptidase [Hyphomicrobiales bacterium]
MIASLSRRGFVLLAPLATAACAGGPLYQDASMGPADAIPRHPVDPAVADMYAEIPDEPFPVPAIDVSLIDPRYLRQAIAYDGYEQPGTIIVDPSNYFLTLVIGDGQAVRYGVGVGREGFGWNGVATIRRKAQWPTWTPPSQMIARQPELEKYRRGMPGGLDNPLGARALYLYQGDRDTLYRIHGTNEPDTIGSSVSSGCIRMFNQDVIDLYGRALTGSKVVVLPMSNPRRPALS